MDTLPITTPRQAGIYVRQAREAQGLTRAALANKAGVSERLLASLELGDATGIRLDNLQPCSTPRCHHAQRPSHSHRRCAAIPVLADAPFTSELYDKAFADFAMSNLGVSIATSASAQTKPEGR